MSRPRAFHTSHLISLAALATCIICPLAFGQTTRPSTITLTGNNPYGGGNIPTLTVPGPFTLTPAATTAPATTAPTVAAPEAPGATQPFVGTVTRDNVYVRSGPDKNYYELGYLGKGDTVQVLGARGSWYQILPPNGTFCMVAKEFVETDAAGENGTVKADYLNIRAGTAINKNREPSAVLAVVRKGTKLTILGSSDKFYEVAPPEKAIVYVSSQFVTAAAAGTDYKIPTLKLPAGAVGPTKSTVTSTPTTLPTVAAEVTTPTPPTPPAPTPGVVATETQPAPRPPVVLPAPNPVFADAYKKFEALNDRYQSELKKPVGTRELDGLIKDYKDFLGTKDLPGSIKQGSERRLDDLEKLATTQRLQKQNAKAQEALDAQIAALREQSSAADKALAEYENSGPYLEQGVLQTSSVVPDKYALVNPVTGRTVAYVDPKSGINLSKLLGEYVGVRGSTHKAPGTEINVISVKNATVLEAPTIAKPATK